MESLYAAFDTNDQSDFAWGVPVIGVEGMLTCERLRYTREYMAPGIGCL